MNSKENIMDRYLFFLKSKFIYLALFLIGVSSRLPFMEKYQSHWDGPDYSLALIRYSFVEKTPTEPGYPLYIAIGKLFSYFIPDIHASILAVSILFAGIGAVVAFFVGKEMLDKRVGIVSSVLFLSSPTFYYFGITANPYGLLFTTTSILALTVYFIILKNKKFGLLLGLAFSFAIGIRPQDVMFVSLLYLLGLFHLNKRERIVSIVSFFLFCSLWFVPVVLLVGGFKIYLSYILNFFQSGPGINLTMDRIITIFPIILKGFYLTFTISSIGLLYYLVLFCQKLTTNRLKEITKYYKMIILFTAWIVPSLIFNIVVRSDHAAHQIAYLSGFLFLSAFAISRFFSKNKNFLICTLLVIAIFNLFTFFRDRDIQKKLPYVSQSYHYSEILKNDRRMLAIVSFVKKFNPNHTIVIIDPEIFRQLTFYLENYNVYAYSRLDTNSPDVVDSVHYAHKLHYEVYFKKNNILNIPNGINYIILIPNNKDLKFNFKVKKEYLSGKALVFVMKVSRGERYLLKLHEIIKI